MMDLGNVDDKMDFSCQGKRTLDIEPPPAVGGLKKVKSGPAIEAEGSKKIDFEENVPVIQRHRMYTLGYFERIGDIESREEMRKMIVGDDADFDIEMPEIDYISNVDECVLFRAPNEWSRFEVPISPWYMVEIFSLSFHRRKTESLGDRKTYHLYGNIYIEDMDHYVHKAIRRSSHRFLTVSDGDFIPLRLERALTAYVGFAVSACVKGHQVDSASDIDSRCDSGECGKESRILIKEGRRIFGRHGYPCGNKPVEYDYPLEEEMSGVDGAHYLKLCYSLVEWSYVVGVEVRLIPSPSAEKPFYVDGNLTVHWTEFDDIIDNEGDQWKITLFDSNQIDPKSTSTVPSRISVQEGGVIDVWRNMLVVPVGCDLQFQADFRINGTHPFDGFKCVYVGRMYGEYGGEIIDADYTIKVKLVQLERRK